MFGQDVKPEFEVEIMEGTEVITRSFYQDGKFTQKEETVPKGYMVYFPSGHSIRVRSMAEMRRLGFDQSPNLIDMESGEQIPKSNSSLKEHSRRKTRKTRASPSATGGVQASG